MAQVLPFKSADVGPASVSPAPTARYLGDILVRQGSLAQAQLEDALEQQRGQDALLGQILVVGGLVSPDVLTDALSEQARARRLDLDALPPDRELMSKADPYLCLRLEAIPWRTVGGRRVIAVANPVNEQAAMQAFGGGAERVTIAIASPAQIRRAVTRHHGAAMAADALTRCPEGLSCRSIAGGRPGLRQVAVGAALVLAVALAPRLAAQALIGWIVVATLATTLLRIVAIGAKLQAGRAATELPATRLVEVRKLPRVSILVPLYKEAKIAKQLLDSLARMTYPAPLLDIKLVLEADDLVTPAAIARTTLPPTIEVITVPNGVLKTKPRAMNYALPFCRGEIVGIYDAEDQPEPGQIRAVVQHLMEAPPAVACVQGYLDFYNHDSNVLARCFTIEYAVWFRVLLHGVQRLGFPLPLGGTTLFFRRRVLEEVGCWDAHNVTEDADLGMRLARFGYRCEMIPTTTLEEANCRPRAWIRQRSRWLKGYAMTWASHMRNPRALWSDLGPRRFVGFQLLLLGGVTAYLSMPLHWLFWGMTLGLELPLWEGLPPLLAIAFSLSIGIGHIVMLLTAMVAVWDDKRGLMPWIFALPVYWPLGAVAAYRAIVEAFVRPFHWHKTEHGHHLAEDAQEAA